MSELFQMPRNIQNSLVVVAAMCVCMAGCNQSEPTGSTSTPSTQTDSNASEHASEQSEHSTPEVQVLTELSEAQTRQKQVALAAKEAMFQKLSSRLMKIIKEKGPAAAIEVCQAEAPAIAEQVRREFGVEIGRTSFRLRNPANSPRDWVQPFVKEKVEEPVFVALPDSKLGAVLPIRLQKKCLLCHGPRDQISQDVLAQLKLRYPHDQATGFQEGDLRGWFWVEVPQSAVKTDGDAPPSADSTAQPAASVSNDNHVHGPGRGHGPGGPGRGRGMMGGHREDMTTIHSLFAARDRISRTVKETSDGAETTTESDDPEVAILLQTHVPAMESRIKEDRPLPPMTFHPIFVALRKHADDYDFEYEDTEKGVRVTYRAEDPAVVTLVREHAALVSRFLKNGMEEIHKPYQLPLVATVSTTPNSEADSDTTDDNWKALPNSAPAPQDNPTTPAKVELGRKLYFDPRLSLTGTVSCNSCHNIMEGGDDGRPSSMGILGRLGPRNAPTVWNSVFQNSQFWDGRAASLEEQAKGPLVAEPEMGMPSHDFVIQRIRRIPGYVAEFQAVFGDNDDVVNIDNAAKAVAAFERTLITPDSPYDRFVTGSSNAMSDQQLRGMKLFDSVGCTECHSGPAFNGWEADSTEPVFQEFPRFTENEYVKKYGLLKDAGRSEVTGNAEDRHHFKTPTLRNITLTAPYFHHGAVETLAEAVRVMGTTQLDTQLTDTQVADIVAFLSALEGEFPEMKLPRLPSRPGESVLKDQAPAVSAH